MNFRIFLFFAGSILFIYACTNTTKKQKELSKQSPKDLFKTHCIVCHGADGTLGMSGAKNLQLSTIEKPVIIQQISKGKGMMTGFEGKLSTSEIDALADYVITLRK